LLAMQIMQCRGRQDFQDHRQHRQRYKQTDKQTGTRQQPSSEIP